MKWEIDRHNWDELGDNAAFLPERISELVNAEDLDRANSLLSLIEAAVVPVDGPLRVPAREVAACLVQGLLSATQTARAEILYLLFQLAGGTVDVSETELVSDVQREVELGLPIYSEIAETGTRSERFHCIDLLSFCARFNQRCLGRSLSIMHRIAQIGDEEARAVAVELDDLARDGYIG
jgi:hypothetical protein